jgi:glycerol dehydrogenase
MAELASQALIGPRKYIQGRGVMGSVGEHVGDLGKDAFVIADENVWGLVGSTVEGSLRGAEVNLIKEVFGGDKAGLPWATAPTVASTDAPTSALAVIYTDDGVFEEYMFFPHNPDLVLVDTQLAANAPYRFLVSGMGDALATWLEARATAEARKSTMAGGAPTMAALALAKLCWDTLISYGFLARQAAEQHVVTPALEKVVEANTLLSGLGFESGGLAAAHAVHNGLTALPETHHFMHGEKVNFGTLTQLALEDRPTEEINDVIAFCMSVGLPTTLAELDLGQAGKDELLTVAKAATVSGETIHNMPFAVTADMVVDAMVAADAFSRAYQVQSGRQPAAVGH